MRPEDVEGSWSLTAWTQDYDDGRVTEPLGSSPVGVITYLGGRMSCIMSRRIRSAFTTGGQWNAESHEKAAAYDDCLAYAGTYEISGNSIVHHVDISLFPNWIGGAQRRVAQLDGDRLTLLARLEHGTSEARTAHLEWRRLAAGAPLPSAEVNGRA